MANIGQHSRKKSQRTYWDNSDHSEPRWQGYYAVVILATTDAQCLAGVIYYIGISMSQNRRHPPSHHGCLHSGPPLVCILVLRPPDKNTPDSSDNSPHLNSPTIELRLLPVTTYPQKPHPPLSLRHRSTLYLWIIITIQRTWKIDKDEQVLGPPSPLDRAREKEKEYKTWC